MNFKVPQVEQLEFDAASHKYWFKVSNDEHCKKHMPFSVTEICKSAFPFDADAKANDIATKYMINEEPPNDNELRKLFEEATFPPLATIEEKVKHLHNITKAHWQTKTDFGSAVHEMLEEYVASEGTKLPPEGTDPKKRISFDAMLAFLAEEKKNGFEPVAMKELKLCMPFAKTKYHTVAHDESKSTHLQKCCGIAGSIDLILYNKETKKCKICDYKTGALDREKWRLQLGLYHLMLHYATKHLLTYDPVSMVVFQINPSHTEKHVFGVTECEISVNVALDDNAFWINGWSDISKITGKFSSDHYLCNVSHDEEYE